MATLLPPRWRRCVRGDLVARRSLGPLRLALAAWLGTALLLAGSAADASAAAQPTWSVLSPPTEPPPLQGAAAAYDPADGTVVVFGGRQADGQLSDATWSWNGSTWTLADPVGAMPPARELGSMAFAAGLDPPQLILFGGRAADGTLLDDTWTWNGVSWYQVTPTSAPGGREGAALAPDADGRLVLFGGYGMSDRPAAVAAPSTTTSAPTTTTATTTTATTTTATTTTATTSTSGPRSTTTTTLAPDIPATTAPVTQGVARRVGRTARRTTSTTTSATPKRPTTPSSVPFAADGGSRVAAADPGTPAVLGDTWLLTGGPSGDEWQQVSTGVAPPAATGASMARGSGDQTVLYGGTPVAPGGDQGLRAADRTWIWNGRTWAEARTKVAPPARFDAAMDLDTDLGGTVLVGGIGTSGALGDTWQWDGSSWSRVEPATPPTPRSGGAGAYDVASRQFLLFGGADRSGAPIAATEVLSSHAPAALSAAPPTTPVDPGSGAKGHGSGPRSTTTPSGGSPSGNGGGSSVGTSGPAGSGAATTSTGRGPLTATSINLHRGDVVTLTGSGFEPHAAITITFHSSPVTVGRTVADAHGDFRVTVAVPTQAAIGGHRFVAEGRGPAGETTLVTPVEVVGLALARHTSRTIAMVAIAVAIPLVTWAVLGGLGRRRRPTAA